MNPTDLVTHFSSSELDTDSREVENEEKKATQQTWMEELLGMDLAIHDRKEPQQIRISICGDIWKINGMYALKCKYVLVYSLLQRILQIEAPLALFDLQRSAILELASGVSSNSTRNFVLIGPSGNALMLLKRN